MLAFWELLRRGMDVPREINDTRSTPRAKAGGGAPVRKPIYAPTTAWLIDNLMWFSGAAGLISPDELTRISAAGSDAPEHLIALIRARAHQQNGAAVLPAADGKACEEILVRTNVGAQARATSSHKGKNELRCFGPAQGNAPPVLEVLRQVVSNSRWLGQFIPELAETLMRDLDAWEEHPKSVLRRHICRRRCRRKQVTTCLSSAVCDPASHVVSWTNAAARGLGAHGSARSGSARSCAHGVLGAFRAGATARCAYLHRESVRPGHGDNRDQFRARVSVVHDPRTSPRA
jgi:hypothetical protein